MTRKIIIWVVVVVGLFGVWFAGEKKALDAVHPSKYGTNLTAFLEAMQPQEVRYCEQDGSTYFLVVGKPVTSLFSLPSGPPAYVFDGAGNLVEWCGDLGDNPDFCKRWSKLILGERIRAQDVRAYIEAGRGNKDGGMH